MSNYFPNWRLYIEARTWTNGSYGLYDYQRNGLNSQYLHVTTPGQLVIKDRTVIFKSQENKVNKLDFLYNPSAFATISDSPEGIKITPLQKEEDKLKEFWEVIGVDGKDIGYEVKLHDEIRIGRMHVKVSQIKRKGISNADFKSNPHDSSEEKKIEEHREALKGAVCRVCLFGQERDDNPLISPCSCTDDNKYMHLECLRKWMMSKATASHTKNITRIRLRAFSCEFCKQNFPRIVKYNGKEISMIMEDRAGSYVVMESSKDGNLELTYIIDLSEDRKYIIGREEACDIRLSDASVSRGHAFLTVSNGNLCLNDNKSKFGTLVLQKGPIILKDNLVQSAWFQCENIIFNVILREIWLRPKIIEHGSSIGVNKKEKSEVEGVEAAGKSKRAIRIAIKPFGF